MAQPPERASRPVGGPARSISTAIKIGPDLTGFRAETALRCAWLRVHAHLLFDVDPTGRLSAQLFDFADLEVAEERGWFQ